jgi:hypothetical protein
MYFKHVLFEDTYFDKCYFEDVTSTDTYFKNCTIESTFFYNTGKNTGDWVECNRVGWCLKNQYTQSGASGGGRYS